jgi:hypothetical protein
VRRTTVLTAQGQLVTAALERARPTIVAAHGGSVTAGRATVFAFSAAAVSCAQQQLIAFASDHLARRAGRTRGVGDRAGAAACAGIDGAGIADVPPGIIRGLGWLLGALPRRSLCMRQRGVCSLEKWLRVEVTAPEDANTTRQETRQNRAAQT